MTAESTELYDLQMESSAQALGNRITAEVRTSRNLSDLANQELAARTILFLALCRV